MKILSADKVEVRIERQPDSSDCKWCLYCKIEKKNKSKLLYMIKTNVSPYLLFQQNKINLIEIINNVAEDFKQDLKNQNKNIEIKIKEKISSKNGKYILGIENRIEQIVANLLDNAISFSGDNKDVIVKVSKLENDKVSINILDEGQGFKEKDTNKIFKRFYSNRPDKFGQHSGLGLNIVKNLVDLHNATIRASNRLDRKGASMEIIFPNA